MKKGFTLIELLVVITIIAIIASIGVTFLRAVSGNQQPFFYNSDYENAEANKRQAEEMRRANDLRERELNLRATPERQ